MIPCGRNYIPNCSGSGVRLKPSRFRRPETPRVKHGAKCAAVEKIIMSGTRALIQARSSSTRFPGKMLREFGSGSVLGSVISRVRAARSVDEVVILTSLDSTDDQICEECDRLVVRYFRGSLENVADRFRAFLQNESIQSFVRISGDSPLIDPNLIDRMIFLFEESGADIASNVVRRTFPSGQSVEVIKTEVFLDAVDSFLSISHFEHVTKFFYEFPGDFSFVSLEADGDFSDIRLSIDYPDDLAILSKMIGESAPTPDWLSLANVWREEKLRNSG